MKGISLGLIIKDETDSLHTLFKSLRNSLGSVPFCEVVVGWNGTNPKTEQILKQYGCKVLSYKWNNNFADARNFVFDNCQGEFIMWLDADDTLVGTEELINVAGEAFADPSCYSVWMQYYYDFDKDKNVCMQLWRERIIRKGTHRWVGAIHESLLPTTDGHNFRTKKIRVEHNIDHQRVQRSGKRNLEIAKEQYGLMKDNKIPLDPRIIINYAKSLDGMSMHREAVPIFEEFLRESEWDDERYQTLLQLGKLYTNSKQYHKAIDMCQTAMKLRPTYGQPYYQLAQVYFRMEKWPEVIQFCEMGNIAKMPTEVLPVDPTEYTLKPGLCYEFAMFQMGKSRESLECIDTLLEQFPSNEALQNRRKFVIQFIAQMELEKSAQMLGKWLETYEKPKLKPFIESLPKVVSDHPDFIRLKHDLEFKHSPIGSGKRIAIYCHATFETWDPTFIQTKGLGGSEEAVVHIAKQLNLLGWSVDVYNNCENEGTHDGVNYYNFWRFSDKLPYEIFIAWRNNDYVRVANKKSRKFVWVHDVQKSEYWSEERLKSIEKVFVLSNWHRKNIDFIKDDKVFVTRNGIDVSQFSQAGKIPRDPYKCIYASSPDRGLDTLLEIWENIEKRVKDAHLHVFYGFTHTYDKLHANNDRMIEFKERMLKKVSEMDSVHYHGKVSHAELHEHMMSSGLWIYPTHFTEISCITAMKCQAAGAVPVCTSLAALDETVQHGYKVEFPIQDERAMKAIENKTVDLLTNHAKQDKIRPDMIKWAKDFYSWQAVAKEWDKLFNVKVGNDR